jgi:hypothetical protein
MGLKFSRQLVAKHQIHLPRQEQIIHSRHQPHGLDVRFRRAERIAPSPLPGPQQSAIDLAAVANPHHKDRQLAALPLVHNAIAANP